MWAWGTNQWVLGDKSVRDGGDKSFGAGVLKISDG